MRQGPEQQVTAQAVELVAPALTAYLMRVYKKGRVVSMTALASGVTYRDTKGRLKAALVLGTPESTNGKLAEGQVSLAVFNPISGHRYFRTAVEQDGVYVSAEAPAAEEDDADSDSEE